MDLWRGTTGPHDARIAIVGEAWGRDEAAAGLPFVGASGQELDRMLAEAGIDRRECFCTNVVSAQPLNNQMWRFFLPRDEGGDTFLGLHPDERTHGELDRLYKQLEMVSPRVVLAAGNYALWALTDEAQIAYKSSDERGAMEGGGRLVPSGIMNFRGSMLWSRLVTGPNSRLRVLPIIHPAAIMRAWENRSITIHDLKTRIPKALSGDWDGPRNRITIRPSLCEAITWFHERIARMDRGAPIECSIDLETMACDNGFRCVTCISFCTEPNAAITIPFIDKDAAGNIIPYWQTPRIEAQAVRAMLRFISHPRCGAIGQNFLYDQSYFRDHWGVVPRLSFDTMLAHHLIWPGTPKDLGHLSSIYCEYHRYWKDDNREWGSKATPDTHFLYNGEDAIRTLEIAQRERDLIEQLGLMGLWTDELEKQELAFEMMERGVRIDLKKRSELATAMIKAAEQHQAMLLRLVPQAVVDDLMEKKKPTGKFWFNSAKQVQFVLSEILGMTLPKDRKSGNPTAGAKAIEQLREKNPIFEPVFQLLENMRSIGVLTRNVLRAPLDPDNRMRCSFNTGGTETFRWSSSENPFGRGTNLQNITSGDE